MLLYSHRTHPSDSALRLVVQGNSSHSQLLQTASHCISLCYLICIGQKDVGQPALTSGAAQEGLEDGLGVPEEDRGLLRPPACRQAQG